MRCSTLTAGPSATYMGKYTTQRRGYNIGQKLIDEFLAKSGVGTCASFREVADVIAKVHTQYDMTFTCPELDGRVN